MSASAETPSSSFRLFEGQAIALLEKATTQAKDVWTAEKSKRLDNRVPVFVRRRASQDDSDDDDSEDESESEEFSEESSEGEGESSSPEALNESNSAEDSAEDPDEQADKVKPLPKPKKKKKPRSGGGKSSKKKDRKRQQLIQKHIENIPRTGVPIDSSKEIRVPSCLLSRDLEEDPLERTLSQCQQLSSLASEESSIMVLLLRSGRFAGAVFDRQGDVLAHKTSSRYTVRRGQGKSQSSQDSNGRKAISIGSQLRRAGEVQLQADVRETLEAWQESYLESADLILVSCPKTMRPQLFQDDLLPKLDPRIRSIPIDFGRPSLDSAQMVYQVVSTWTIGDIQIENEDGTTQQANGAKSAVAAAEILDRLKIHGEPQPQPKPLTKEEELDQEMEKETTIPLSQIHIAARDGDAEAMLALLPCPEDIDLPAGDDFMVPLHYAAASNAAECVRLLLVEGHADPTLMDARGRLPYFVASTAATRDAFRVARYTLGEDAWNWSADAKVDAALSPEDLQTRKDKEAAKKRKKREKQKAKKATEKAEAEAAEQQEQAEKEQKAKELEAKRARDALPAGAKTGANVCDFCQTECKGKQRKLMLTRLEYKYCSSECVQKHKRELMAKAALARFG